MTLLLTILSAIGLWTLLALLVIGLQVIYKVLESIRGNLERIAMGVRAIERETRPLAPRARAAAELVTGVDGALGRLTSSLGQVVRALDSAAPALSQEEA